MGWSNVNLWKQTKVMNTWSSSSVKTKKTGTDYCKVRAYPQFVNKNRWGPFSRVIFIYHSHVVLVWYIITDGTQSKFVHKTLICLALFYCSAIINLRCIFENNLLKGAPSWLKEMEQLKNLLSHPVSLFNRAVSLPWLIHD